MNYFSLKKWKWKSLSHVQLFVTTWIAAHQAPLSMGFPRQEYWSGLTFSSPGNLPNPGIKPRSPALQEDSLPSGPSGKPLWQEGWTKYRIITLLLRATVRGLEQPWNCDKWPLTSQQEGWSSRPHEPRGLDSKALRWAQPGQFFYWSTESFPSSQEVRSQGCIQFDLAKHKNLRFLH